MTKVKNPIERILFHSISEIFLILGSVVIVSNYKEILSAWYGILFVVFAVLIKLAYDRDFS